MEQRLYVSNRNDWRKWLEKNHKTVKIFWLTFYKSHTGKTNISYDDAVEEALCFGWIDSIIKKIDDDKYCRKFTPRNNKSIWSELNKKRIAKMIKEGKMTKAGMDKINAAKKNGEWNKKSVAATKYDMPIELSELLSKNKIAKEFFESLTNTYQKQYIGWIASAKKEETIIKRAKEAIELLKKKQKLGLR